MAQTKPHPDPYLTAAALLGADPARCVAIEDSPTGIASARAAGCAVLAVPARWRCPDTAGVTLVDSLERLDVATLRALAAGRSPPDRRLFRPARSTGGVSRA